MLHAEHLNFRVGCSHSFLAGLAFYIQCPLAYMSDWWLVLPALILVSLPFDSNYMWKVNKSLSRCHDHIDPSVIPTTYRSKYSNSELARTEETWMPTGVTLLTNHIPDVDGALNDSWREWSRYLRMVAGPDWLVVQNWSSMRITSTLHTLRPICGSPTPSIEPRIKACCQRFWSHFPPYRKNYNEAANRMIVVVCKLDPPFVYISSCFFTLN